MADAEKREKAIRGLEACNRQSYNGSDCQNCPYYDDEDTAELPFGICNIQDMFDDALALLKEQEPRVLTWEEVDKSGNLYVWTEIHSFYSGRGCLVYCTVVRSEFFYELIRLREDSGLEWTRAEEDYNRDNYQGAHSGWRCWSARPTEEQRKAAKWDET